MKLAIAIALLTLSTIAFADPAHDKALRTANDQFTKATKKCEAVKVEADRNKCVGAAKAKHTKAVEKADAAMAKKAPKS